MAIKRIGMNDIREFEQSHVVVRAPPPAPVTNSVAEQEANRSAGRVIALEREVGFLKDKMILIGMVLREIDPQSDEPFGEARLAYLQDLADPAKPLPAPVMTVKEPE
jgi:hypothetical protein